jgi:hypothetical protein
MDPKIIKHIEDVFEYRNAESGGDGILPEHLVGALSDVWSKETIELYAFNNVKTISSL